jgi:diguanylate cyclase (GGDEF)-like protein
MKNISDLYLVTQHKLKIALSDYVYRQAFLGFSFSVVLASIIALNAFFSIGKNKAIAWYGFFILVTILRFLLVKCYQKGNKNNIVLWYSLFIISACGAGICWGLSGLILLSYQNPIQASMVVMMLASVTAGAVPLFAGFLSAAIAFLISALLPMAIHLLVMNGRTYILLGIIVGVYLPYLILLSIKQNKMIKKSLNLQVKKTELVKNLKKMNKKLAEEATHDCLTHLTNRAFFESNLIQAIKRTQRYKKALALFYFDLDGFKKINDTYGHHVGDLLLIEVADRLRKTLRNTDIPARFGGDEFAIILEDISQPNSISQIAEKLLKALNKSFRIADLEIKCTISIGISICPINAADVDSLLQGADKAMYYVKQQGGNNYCFDVSKLQTYIAIPELNH